MTRTHCPYCSLQCGMTLQRRGGPRWRSCRGRSSRSTRARCAARAGRRPSCRGHRERLTTPLIRDRATGELRAAGWDEALDLIAGKIARAAGVVRRRQRRRSSAAAGSPTRRPTSSASSPGSRSAPARSTTTAAGACRRPRAPATRRSASTAACRSRWPTSSRPTSSSSSAPTWPRRCRRPRATSTGSASAAARSSSSTRAGPPTADRADLFLQPVPGTDLALAQGVTAPARSPAGAVDEEYVAARTTGFDAGPPLGRVLVAGAGRAGHRRRDRPSSGSSPTCSPPPTRS